MERWLLGWTTLALGLGCAGLPLGGRVVLVHELDGAAREAAVALGDQVTLERLPAEVTGADADAVAAACEAHGTEFVWLAARDARPEVRTAALVALPPCVSGLERADLVSVTRGALQAEARHELAAGFVLAGVLLPDEPAESPLTAEVIELVGAKDPAVRYDALQALDHSLWSAEPRALEALVEVLRAPEPWLVTEALRLLRFRATGVEQRDGLRDACRALLSDLDPGIRGRAALALARLTPEDPELAPVVVGLLDDPHGYARSAAAEALADMTYLPAIHDLVARIDDGAPNTWDMLPFQRLDDTPVVQHHVGSLFERTDDAFLRALVRLTEPLGESRFEYREVHLGRWRDLDILAAGRDAKRWYESHAAEIPTR